MKKFIIILAAISTAFNVLGREKAGSEARSSSATSSSGLGSRVMAECATPKASRELWINNVRTIIYTGGDMWWDLNGNGNAFYYVPAVENRNNGISSTFAGSIWLGGFDVSGQLKVAAMTYRQNGKDFWPGPLDTTDASVTPEVCTQYDKFYSITTAEVEAFVNGGGITQNIIDWPGNADRLAGRRPGQAARLAPYVDVDFNGFYNPEGGDYPAYDVEHKAEKDPLGFCKTKLYGDQTLFWVFNDRGGPHTETQGYPIGVEVRAQAFGFKTNDEINNMTFYSYEIHNRSSFQLNKTYFTIWNDADLGYYLDDYVGCDVGKGLGYIYNADPFDETYGGSNGYGDYPPAFGCDFFKGPVADANDGIDNDYDNDRQPAYPGELVGTDEPGETIQMSRFTYYNNNVGAFPPQTLNPDISTHYYGYMTGFWKDGSPFTEGGNAYGGSTPATFVYNGNPVTNTGWTERGSGNPPGDRRFLQSAGPFTLKPGAVNDIIYGMPWAQSPNKGGNLQSLDLLFNADTKAQRLFDNCFKILDGPEAPNMTIQEINNGLIIYLTNEKGKSNNYNKFNNDYADEDINISLPGVTNVDNKYRFEGYKVYQVRGSDVTANDLEDITKAKLIFQCDVANDVTDLVNYEKDNSLGGYVPKQKVKNAANKGVVSTFRVTEDGFSTTDNRNLVNNKTYYFLAVAYAYNQYLKYEQDKSPAESPNSNYLGQKTPYLEGRLSKRAAGTPHNTDSEKDGTLMQASYGFGPKITRVEGQGNGGNKLTLTKESEEAIVKNFFVDKITYENGQGPVNIKVVDPLNVKKSSFSFRFINSLVTSPAPTVAKNAMISSTVANTYTGTIATLNANNTSWELKDLDDTTKVYHANEIASSADSLYQPIRVGNEFYFQDLGLAVSIVQVSDPGEEVNMFTSFTSTNSLTPDYTGPKDGSFIGASVSYVDGASNWLSPLVDQDGLFPTNWILSGTTTGDENGTPTDAYYQLIRGDKGASYVFYDPKKQYGKILGGTWAPYPLCGSYYSYFGRISCGPGFNKESWNQDERLSTIKKQTGASTPYYEGSTDLRKLSSVLVVLTKDKTKWTRCVVLEMQEKSQLSEGNAIFFAPRNHTSVDKNGNPAAAGSGASNSVEAPNFISETGMGWFPGYAINLETGERLNMAFGEDSYQKENNGNDMIWNPTSNLNTPFSFAMGGKHFVYVFGGNSISTKYPTGTVYPWSSALAGKEVGVGRYDYGQHLIEILKTFIDAVYARDVQGPGGALSPLTAIERDIMWVSVPMLSAGYSFTKPDQMPSDVRFQINVTKPYRYGYSGIANLPVGTQNPSNYNKLVAVNSPSIVTTHVSSAPQNGNFPLYTFNTSDIATLFNQSDLAKKALDLIKIVPNPYYGSSTYETNRTDNKVRITDLPNKCTIKIYTMNGTLVRTIKRDVSGQEDLSGASSEINQSRRTPYVEWDLKNDKNISVASGLYVFYIDAPGIGEKVLKWFGVMRPLDVQSY